MMSHVVRRLRWRQPNDSCDPQNQSQWHDTCHLGSTPRNRAAKRLSNLNQFKKKFTRRFLGKFVVKWILKIPSHLTHVATLPCETLMAAKQVINDKLQDSVATYLRWGAMWVLISVKLQIYQRMFSWIFFLNRLRFDRIVVMSMWLHCFWPTLYIPQLALGVMLAAMIHTLIFCDHIISYHIRDF